MAAVTKKNNDEKDPMSADLPPNDADDSRDDDDDDDRDDSNAPKPKPKGSGNKGGGTDKTKKTGPDHGFFSIYKPGQGYWTRFGTIAGGVLLGLLTAQFIYVRLTTWLPPVVNSDGSSHPNTKLALGIVIGFLVLFGLMVFKLVNKPANVDFLILTDSEMKKVNWTSKKELIGSTQIVIIFMFLIAAFLFAMDIVFGYIFYKMGVLLQPPL